MCFCSMKDDGSQKNFPTWQMFMAENQSTWNFTFVNKFHFTSHTETLFLCFMNNLWNCRQKENETLHLEKKIKKVRNHKN